MLDGLIKKEKVKLAIMLEGASGGARKHVVDLLLALDKNRYAITFIYSLARADALFVSQLPLLARAGIELVEIPMSRGFQGLFDIKSLLAIKSVFARISPDIVHVHGAKAGALGRLAAWMQGVRGSVYTPHGGSFHKFGGASGLVYRIIEKSLYRESNHIIGVSESSCALAGKFNLARPEHIHLVHNGLHLAAIDAWHKLRPETEKEFSGASKPFTVLYPASFLEAKGHLQFLDALHRGQKRLHPQIIILLAGEGPLEDKVRRQIESLGLRNHFRFLGFQANLYEYYHGSDLVLLPSRSEAFPYVLLEAMAFSKPVVATRVGGVPELVVDGYNGILIDPGRLTDLPDRLNHCLEHPEDLRTMGLNGRRTVEARYTVEHMVAKIEQIYMKTLIGGNTV